LVSGKSRYNERGGAAVALARDPRAADDRLAGGRGATLLVWSPDYDGKGKAWVRFDDGGEAIVGGSRISR